jgi:hypothetical protein
MGWIEVIEEALRADGIPYDAKAIASALVGAMTLARTVDDPSLSNALLESARKTIKAGLTLNRHETASD